MIRESRKLESWHVPAAVILVRWLLVTALGALTILELWAL